MLSAQRTERINCRLLARTLARKRVPPLPMAMPVHAYNWLHHDFGISLRLAVSKKLD